MAQSHRGLRRRLSHGNGRADGRRGPSSQRDTAGLELWVPLPKEPGPYFVRLTLSVDDAPLASADSGPVD